MQVCVCVVPQAARGGTGGWGEQHALTGLPRGPGGDLLGQGLPGGPSVRLLRVGLPGQQRPGDGPRRLARTHSCQLTRPLRGLGGIYDRSPFSFFFLLPSLSISLSLPFIHSFILPSVFTAFHKMSFPLFTLNYVICFTRTEKYSFLASFFPC